ncbi:MAG: hypothetical protein IJU40_00065 [Desulfovibrionaceae bacterium]|nr:hypothetical protein [Desulfovibrionaceae bacterium]
MKSNKCGGKYWIDQTGMARQSLLFNLKNMPGDHLLPLNLANNLQGFHPLKTSSPLKTVSILNSLNPYQKT